MGKKVRIGIDVGGTFTDAVVIDATTYEVLAKRKIPTTHSEGVAHGVVEIISALMKENQIAPEDVTFIAHGTTQATNALLEGDVAQVGIVGMATGVDATPCGIREPKSSLPARHSALTTRKTSCASPLWPSRRASTAPAAMRSASCTA